MIKPHSRTLSALIDELAVTYPDRSAVTFADETISFAEFRARTLALARALHADGVRPGDKIGILMGNRIEWLVANFAIQYLGATTVALNTWYTSRELYYVLGHAEVSTLIASDRCARADYVEMIDGYRPWGESVPRLRRVVMLGDRLARDAISYADLLARAEETAETVVTGIAAKLSPTDMAYLLYTSGSTARPKGVMLQHDSLIENPWNIGERLQFDSSDVIYMPISLFWGLACESILFATWTHGAHLVLQDQFDADKALELVERHRCTAFFGTPNIVYAVFQHPDRARYDLSSLRKGVASGSPETTRSVIESGLPLACHCYGLTESYGFATVNGASDPVDKRCNTEGRALPGTELRIVNPVTGQSVPAGEAGEVRLRGHVTPGYYKNPEATAASFDADGFFKTGDLGVLDAEGYLLFRGRLKEMLKTGGMNVAPAEVEEVLRQHPSILDAFITGLPDPVRDEAVAAIIVLHEGCTLGEDEVIAYCRSALAAYKVPRRVMFTTMERLPQTTTGKIHRMRLIELFASETDAT